MSNISIHVTLDGVQIECVEKYKYYGSIISSCLLEKSNLERLKSSFNRCVGIFLRKFSNVEVNVKLSLFDSLCMSFYGIDLFMNKTNSG